MTLLRSGVRALRRVVIAAGAALLALALFTPPASSVIPERADSCATEPASAPLRYVVVFSEGTTRRQARREITGACGTQAEYYPEIAVAVATSAEADFARRIGVDRAFSAQAARRAHAGGGGRQQQRLTRERRATTDRTREQWNLRMINADRAQRAGARGDRDVVVGVLDSGINARHPDLADAVAPRLSADCLTGSPETSPRAWRPTASPHGTHVAGIIAAADDGIGITGVAPETTLASIKVIGEQGYADPESAVCGYMWAARHDMRITNSSYFVDPWSLSCTNRDGLDVVREAIGRAVDHAADQGAVNVAAATNDATDLTPAVTGTGGGCEALPASLRSVVTVSATGKDRLKADYSSYGLGVISVTAPGGSGDACVLSTVPRGYRDLCGTSMAAPHVSGVLALLAAEHPNASPERLHQRLTASTRQLPCPDDYDLTGDGTQDAYCTGYRAYNGFYGYGMVDAAAALGLSDDANDSHATSASNATNGSNATDVPADSRN
ncbi:MAG: S8 family serine peptidase [Actinophytocola sp.]|nr:S8 family serine peptidase [Actinophytocola sp.]